jgi:hypothetical protein
VLNIGVWENESSGFAEDWRFIVHTKSHSRIPLNRISLNQTKELTHVKGNIYKKRDFNAVCESFRSVSYEVYSFEDQKHI